MPTEFAEYKMKILTSFLSLLCVLTECMGEKIIHTTSGKIRGKKIKVLNEEVYTYLGIPYAEPPVDKLRFKVPQPALDWDDVYNATVMSPICMQDPVFPSYEWVPRDLRYMSEDCLYLNIWVPAHNNLDEPFTTMVWIHGGAFNTGSANMNVYHGRVLSSKGNVIVVSINYRLGAFGFLSLDDDNVPGNMGLLDQVMALKWIYRNIDNFGGDKNDITIFGSSAGSISVAHYLISALTKGLFKRAILQSGSNYNPVFSVDKDVNVKTSKTIAKNVGCGSSEGNSVDNDLLTCLQRIDAEKIANAEKLLMKSRNTILSFTPQNGTPLLPSDPIANIDKGLIHDVEVMIGTSADEASLFLAFFKPEFMNQDDPVLTKSEGKHIISSFYNMSGAPLDLLVEEYFGHLQDDDYSSIFHRTKDAMGDGIMSCPIVTLEEKLLEHRRTVYSYTLNHARSKVGYKKWVGVPHFEEISFMFGLPFLFPEKYTMEEREFSSSVINYWVSFAKTGKPSDVNGKVEWLPFDSKNRYTLSLKPGDIRNHKEEPKEECQMWKKLWKE